MITEKQVPDEVRIALRDLFRRMEDAEFELSYVEVAATVINSWPGVKWHEIQVPDDSDEVRYMLKKIGVILPLTQETK